MLLEMIGKGSYIGDTDRSHSKMVPSTEFLPFALKTTPAMLSGERFRRICFLKLIGYPAALTKTPDKVTSETALIRLRKTAEAGTSTARSAWLMTPRAEPHPRLSPSP